MPINLLSNSVSVNKPELQLLNVVFRHGDRTPVIETFYPTDPYKDKKYYPEGLGVLTNKGKSNAFKLGKMLRQKYDTFLNRTYIPSNVYARSSDYERTKMTLQFVLAGLYPSKDTQKLHETSSLQLFPIVSFPKSQDELTLHLFACKKFDDYFQEVMESDDVAEKIRTFECLINKVTRYTGMEMKHFLNMYALYGHLQSQQSIGLKLPSWTQNFFPNGELQDAAIAGLEFLSYNDNLKKRNGGPFVRRIRENMLAVKNGTLEDRDRQIYLYSAHDISVAGLISALNIKNTRVPEFCTAIIIELYQDDGKYYIKLLQYLGKPSEFQELQIPGCPMLCPLEKFMELTEKIIPSDEEIKCD